MRCWHPVANEFMNCAPTWSERFQRQKASKVQTSALYFTPPNEKQESMPTWLSFVQDFSLPKHMSRSTSPCVMIVFAVLLAFVFATTHAATVPLLAAGNGHNTPTALVNGCGVYVKTTERRTCYGGGATKCFLGCTIRCGQCKKRLPLCVLYLILLAPQRGRLSFSKNWWIYRPFILWGTAQ